MQLREPLHQLLLFITHFNSFQPHFVKLLPHMSDLAESVLEVSTSNFVFLLDRLKLSLGLALDLFVCSDGHVQLRLQQ